MNDITYQPFLHDHQKILIKARQRKGFREAYESLDTEYQVANQLLRARAHANLTQEAVAQKMGTTKSVISRLESAVGKHSPSLQSLKRYAQAVDCVIEFRLVPKN